MTAVAFVHDYLTQRGGAERVVVALHRAWPEVPIYTSLYEPTSTFPDLEGATIRTSVLDRVPPLRQRHRLALPLLAPVFSAMQIEADVVVCSSSGWAHGARTDGRKVVYCYAPARWLYQADAYLADRNRAAELALRALGRPLRRWDLHAAQSADRYLAISTRSRDLIRAAYGIDAEIIFPPCGVDPDGPREPTTDLEPGYFLCVSRLLPYKNVDAIVASFSSLPDERLVIVGTGPDEDRLSAMATRNVSFLPSVSDNALRWLYANARALVAASLEDFGLTPVEAAAFGTPSIVLRFGGYLDTVVEGETGLFFDEPTPHTIADAIGELRTVAFDPDVLRRHAGEFSHATFRRKLAAAAGLD